MNTWYHYCKYFFYLAYHWNLRLALFIIFHEIKGEKKYGIRTMEIDDLKDSVSEKDRIHSSIYQPVNYFIAEWLFSNLAESEIKNASFLDAGCGKGRTLIMAAHAGIRNISGFDISPKLCHNAINLVESKQSLYPDATFEVTCKDAKLFRLPDDITIIFLFNPFKGTIMQPFIQSVSDSLYRYPREIKILYANPEYGILWQNAGFKKIAAIQKLSLLHGEIFQYQPE